MISHAKQAKPKKPMKRSKTLGLPQEIICKILEHLCDEFEPNGIRIFPVIATELVQIALSCRDFNAALPHCYKYFASRFITTPPPVLPQTHDWQELIANPTKLKMPELKTVLMCLDEPTSGLKRGKF